jgi:Homeodomain-like domain-containing protein
MTESQTSSRRLTAKQRRQAAFEARKRGYTYERIGRMLGISRQAAYKTVKSELVKIELKTAETAEEIKRLELERLDALQNAFWEKAISGDEKAANHILRIMERKSRLLGLDEQIIDRKAEAEARLTHKAKLAEIREFKERLKQDQKLETLWKKLMRDATQEDREKVSAIISAFQSAIEKDAMEQQEK